jgi:hypothetical protein
MFPLSEDSLLSHILFFIIIKAEVAEINLFISGIKPIKQNNSTHLFLKPCSL